MKEKIQLQLDFALEKLNEAEGSSKLEWSGYVQALRFTLLTLENETQTLTKKP